jgi:hypothetical protein
MSGALASDARPPAPAGEAPLEWSFNPWRERPGAAALAAVLTLGLCVIVLAARQSFVLTVALCLAAAGALAPALTPLYCRVDESGLARRGPLGWERRIWSEIRRAALRAGGLFLSPYAERHWLDPYRGMFLPLPRAERERLSAALRPRLERHGL